MAVYTDVSAEELADFLAGYDLGELLAYKGIAEGVENSNYLVHTARGYFILTLYEKRVERADLPFFIGLMEHLAKRGITCPQPVKNRAGEALGVLAGRPAALVTFLEGMWIRRPAAWHCAAVGEALARLHLAGDGFPLRRANALSVDGWRPLFEIAESRADTLQPDLRGSIADELAYLERAWPRGLPQGVIHADLFPDNVFFLGSSLSGLIDFYFACTDTLAYDVAICLNAWCFEPDHSFNVTKGRALLQGYMRTRPLAAAEQAAMPVLARGAALRFLLTRLVDWLNVPPGALVRPKDPLEYFRKLRFHQRVATARDYGLDLLEPAAEERRLAGRPATKPIVSIFTDGGAMPNPGPGGWGAVLRYSNHQRELKGGEAHATNNQMELLAAISALEALKQPCSVDLHTDSQYVRNGITKWIHDWKRNGWRTADKQPVKNIDLWQRLEAAIARHDVRWHWVKGHAGHELNERADRLASEAIAAVRAGLRGAEKKPEL